jgi:hypothetical protein
LNKSHAVDQELLEMKPVTHMSMLETAAVVAANHCS